MLDHTNFSTSGGDAVGGKVMYTCIHGYQRQSGLGFSRCLLTSKWTMPTLICEGGLSDLWNCGLLCSKHSIVMCACLYPKPKYAAFQLLCFVDFTTMSFFLRSHAADKTCKRCITTWYKQYKNVSTSHQSVKTLMDTFLTSHLLAFKHCTK